MPKKSTIILSVVVSILSFVVTLLSFLEIKRYMAIKKSKVKAKSYIEKYSTLSKNNGKVVISMAVDNKDVGTAMPTLVSLLDQSVKVDRIYINLLPGQRYDIPQKVKDIAITYKSGKNYGCLSCLVPTLLRELDRETLILCVKPETVYGSDFVQTMVEEITSDDSEICIAKNIVGKNCGFITRTSVFRNDITLSHSNCKNIDDLALNMKVKYVKVINCF